MAERLLRDGPIDGRNQGAWILTKGYTLFPGKPCGPYFLHPLSRRANPPMDQVTFLRE